MRTNTDSIRILAFGDSNTWGRKPGDDNNARFASNERWTGVLQENLGDRYEIIEEGLNGRTTNTESPQKAGKNGRYYFFACLESHKPLDIVILALGKNDLKAKYNRSATDVSKGLEECLEAFLVEGRDKNGQLPKLIILSVAIVEEVERQRFGNTEVDFLGARSKSIELVPLYRKLAEKYSAIFIDLSNDVKVSNIDGVHLDISEHKKIGKILSEVVSKITF